MNYLIHTLLVSELSRVMRRLFEGVKGKLLYRICAGKFSFNFILFKL